MSENLKQVLAGAGSYVALIVMVWFAMHNAPAWLTLLVGITNGILFTWLMGKIIPATIRTIQFLWSCYSIWFDYGFESQKNRLLNDQQAALFAIYSAYIHEQANLSNLRKGID